ncbi:MAG: tRNA (adenosine(37)-N6)-threonylcarbamoyltransferase complex ATPase subunit type 1 TsaE [Planctomycetaceae bacterium]|nr:tRNA (adenosine(37)-N6)-threonylcarbamoyltransferase complex ATPase subunit type 1 TsaE [Planctomycetaceae bacterium]
MAGLLAVVLKPGDVIGLDGELGAGKTHFVQAVAAQLGFDPAQVTSPTFTLIQEYPTAPLICHLDAYRLHDSDEFLELGVDELLGGEVVCLIEWASRVADVLPKDYLQLNFETLSESSRRISFVSNGPRSQKLLDNVRAAYSRQ